jgi:hypothetical protein
MAPFYNTQCAEIHGPDAAFAVIKATASMKRVKVTIRSQTNNTAATSNFHLSFGVTMISNGPPLTFCTMHFITEL